MSEPKRVTILFGNGAVVDQNAWNAPSTKEITNNLCEDKTFKITKCGENIFNFIYQKLLNSNFDEEKINFEILISILEDIFEFSAAQYLNQFNFNHFNLPFLFNEQKWLEELKNFQITKEGFFESEIDGKEIIGGREIRRNRALQENHFFRKLIGKAFLKVAEYVRNYCINIEKQSNCNKKVKSFIEEFLENNGYLVRCYTTNYDRLLPEVFGKEREVFDGFAGAPKENINVPYDLKKIFYEKNVLNYYNLHGSVFWDLDSNVSGDTPDYEFHFYRTSKVNTDIIGRDENVNNSQPLHVSNIVTGLNKLQRLSLNPLNAFYSSFQEDCIKSDLLITIGYSFGDPHLNKFIKNGVGYDDTKLLHVTQLGDQKEKNNLENTQEGQQIKNLLPKDNYFEPRPNGNKNWLVSKRGSHKIYTNGFVDFLDEDFEKIGLS